MPSASASKLASEDLPVKDEPGDTQGSEALSRRRVVAVLVIVVLGSLLVAPLALGFLRYGSPLEYFRRRAFDSQTWRAAGSEDDRIRMVDDLVDDVLRVGMTRAEIEGLLGPVSQTSKFADWDLVYRLGMERSLMSIDSEWLVVRLGAEGRVTEFRIVRD